MQHRRHNLVAWFYSEEALKEDLGEELFERFRQSGELGRRYGSKGSSRGNNYNICEFSERVVKALETKQGVYNEVRSGY